MKKSNNIFKSTALGFAALATFFGKCITSVGDDLLRLGTSSVDDVVVVFGDDVVRASEYGMLSHSTAQFADDALLLEARTMLNTGTSVTNRSGSLQLGDDFLQSIRPTHLNTYSYTGQVDDVIFQSYNKHSGINLNGKFTNGLSTSTDDLIFDLSQHSSEWLLDESLDE